MKLLARILIATLLLLGSTSTIALADGTSPPADCNPFTTNCPPVVPTN